MLKRIITKEFLLSSRSFSNSAIRYKGHSKWQNIKHIKEANDAKISRLHMKYSNLIQIAIRENGMEKDPHLNRALAKVIDEAESLHVRKSVIEKAIKSFDKSKDAMDEFILELRGPAGVAVLVEAMANKRNFAESKVFAVSKKHALVGEYGALRMFGRQGVSVVRAPPEFSLDQAEEVAIELEAEEVDQLEAPTTSEGEAEQNTFFRFRCDPVMLNRWTAQLPDKFPDLTLEHAEIIYVPKVVAPVSKAQRKVIERGIAAIEEKCDCVTAVHHNMEEEDSK